MKSMLLPKQYLHFPLVPHKTSFISAVMWFLKKKNPNCKGFCPTCKYYFRCQEDVAMMENNEDFNFHWKRH